MRRIILSTDWWTDCDDAVAIRVLARAAARGDITVSGVVVNACMADSARSILGYLAHEGLGGVPVALDRTATDFGGTPRYQQRLARTLGASRSEDECETPTALMRRLLADSPDGGTELIEIGFPHCLAALLASEGDENSPLDGRSLIARKVGHLTMMAGNYADEQYGKEHNFAHSPRAAAGGAAVCRDWPTEITFLGWEVGNTVISGSRLPEGDVLKQILDDHGSHKGRSSWDPMTVCLALHGDAAAAGYETVRGTVTVDPVTGENSFARDAAGRHVYVKKTLPDAAYADEIDGYLI